MTDDSPAEAPVPSPLPPPSEPSSPEPEIEVAYLEGRETSTNTASQEEHKGAEKPSEVVVEGNSGDKNNASDDDPEADSRRPHPFPFYCPISNRVMKDPVVVPNGDSFERSAIVERGDHPSEQMYPNRALLAIIEETREVTGSSLRAGLKRMERSMRQGFQKMLSKSSITSKEARPLSDAFYCPITMSLIHQPVIDPEGNTFENEAIKEWIREHSTSPMTRNPLSLTDLYPNNAISELMQLEMEQSVETMHPSVRRFKEEAAPTPTADNADDDGSESANMFCTCVSCLFLIVITAMFPFYVGSLFVIVCIIPGCLACCLAMCVDDEEEEGYVAP